VAILAPVNQTELCMEVSLQGVEARLFEQDWLFKIWTRCVFEPGPVGMLKFGPKTKGRSAKGARRKEFL